MIFLDTNVLSETMRAKPDAAVQSWLVRHDASLALSTVVIAEIAFGIEKIRPEQRAGRYVERLSDWRRRFAGRVFGLTEEAAMAYGELMGAAIRRGVVMSALDGMIAAIARVNSGRLATRNMVHFQTTELDLISPWDF